MVKKNISHEAHRDIIDGLDKLITGVMESNFIKTAEYGASSLWNLFEWIVIGVFVICIMICCCVIAIPCFVVGWILKGGLG